ncbi:MAG: BtpA/SgcQ family protein [Bacilli bacterium]|jgi:membrane complex biogenesis BtpA family protein|nr:BtpA/SgcQ family protein [Bacilli bacterium]MCH4235585.1 BtpA/SgcQ family protein [Bacilli bacterium]
MNDFFKKYPKAIIGMVHCLPLPGTARFSDLSQVRTQALADALTLQKAGYDAIMIENMGDAPYAEKMDLAQITAMSAIAEMIKEAVDLPLGIDCAFSDYRSALAIAKAVGADFIRIPVFIDTVVYANGIIYPSAHDALIYRREIGAEKVLIMADLQVKHTHMLVNDMSIEESAKLAEASGADAVVVTGVLTGKPTSIEDIEQVKKVVTVPVYVGSGVSVKNIKDQLSIASGVIVGSSLKDRGEVSLPVDFDLAKELIEAYKK